MFPKQLRLVCNATIAVTACALLTSWASAADDDDQLNAFGQVLPTNQRITPLAAPGATLNELRPGLSEFPSYTAGGAMTTVISPDGKTLLVLTSGFNRMSNQSSVPTFQSLIRPPFRTALKCLLSRSIKAKKLITYQNLVRQDYAQKSGKSRTIANKFGMYWYVISASSYSAEAACVMPAHPTAFFSYSWDDDTHKLRVREFATQLRGRGRRRTGE